MQLCFGFANSGLQFQFRKGLGDFVVGLQNFFPQLLNHQQESPTFDGCVLAEVGFQVLMRTLAAMCSHTPLGVGTSIKHSLASSCEALFR